MAYTPKNANGSATSANSSPVVIASDQATVPVSLASVPSHAVTNAGTFATQAVQSGTWTMQPGNTANTTAWKVDGSAVTQPVSAASLPLPALASTSTKQSDGSQKSQIVDGSGNVVGATGNALDVNVKTNNSVGTLSTNNSSTATLLAAATFTGTSDDALAYSEVRVSLIASHASGTNGLSIQQSSDNTNWDITDTYTIPATTGKTFVVPRQARYIRVVYTNGGTNQTSFRLQTILNRTGATPTSQRPQDAYSIENDMQETWALNSLYNGTTFDLMRGDITNGLDVDVTRLPTLANVTTVATVTNVATIGTSITPGTGATNLGKAEDAPASSGDTGVPIFGVRNDALTAAQTSATGDYGLPSIDTSGILMTAGAPRLLKARQVTTLTASTAETTIVTAIASTFNDIYGLILSNTSATATEVTIRDATAGGTISSFTVPAGDTRGFMLPLDSAVPQATVNNAWTAQCSASVTSLKVTALFVKRV